MLAEQIVRAPRRFDGLGRVADRLNGRRVQRDDHHLHVILVHEPQAQLVDIEKTFLHLVPFSLHEILLRVAERVGMREMLFEANLGFHACASKSVRNLANRGSKTGAVQGE